MEHKNRLVIKSDDVLCWNKQFVTAFADYFKYLKFEFTPVKNEHDQIYTVNVSRIVYDNMRHCTEIVADENNEDFFEYVNREVYHIVYFTKIASRWFFMDYTLSAMMMDYMQKRQYICKFVNGIIYKFDEMRV